MLPILFNPMGSFPDLLHSWGLRGSTNSGDPLILAWFSARLASRALYREHEIDNVYQYMHIKYYYSQTLIVNTWVSKYYGLVSTLLTVNLWIRSTLLTKYQFLLPKEILIIRVQLYMYVNKNVFPCGRGD